MTIVILSHKTCLCHNPGEGHPENPERLNVITKALNQVDFTELVYKDAPKATKAQLTRVHDAKYIDFIFQTSPKDRMVHLDPDTVMNPHTLNAALHAAGAVVEAVNLVLSGETNVAFCNVRPPGHHAEHAKAMGFCFFNNLAVGVAHAIAHHNLKRIAIVDFDVHQGNGTEDIFSNHEHVLIYSLYEDHLYPFPNKQNRAKNIISLPLPSNADSKLFHKRVQETSWEKLRNFKPQMIFCSAGFDSHRQDNISSLKLETTDFQWISQQIRQLADEFCQGRIVSVLEGGYALDSLGQNVVAHLRGLTLS